MSNIDASVSFLPKIKSGDNDVIITAVRYFDKAVRNYFNDASNRSNFNYDGLNDGNQRIREFLKDYAQLKHQYSKKGEQIAEPKVLKEYPFLSDYVETRIELEGFKDLVNEAQKLGDKVTAKQVQEIALSLSDLLEKNERRAEKHESYTPQWEFELAFGSLYAHDKSPLMVNVWKELENLKQTSYKNLVVENRRLMSENRFLKEERETNVYSNEDLQNMTDEQRKQNFDTKNKLMREHPVMLEACLNSMFESYVLTKDETIKKEMLGDLYGIRKGDKEHPKTDAEKRDIAKTFKRVLDRNPDLQKDENLVSLSKIDTPFARPTKRIKEQVTRY